MSIARCDMCEEFIDTDEQPEAYYQRIPNFYEYSEVKLDEPRCEPCNMIVYKQIQAKQKAANNGSDAEWDTQLTQPTQSVDKE